MNKINRHIADWIKPYATIVGEGIEVDQALKKTHTSKYFLQLTIPKGFEGYAICLHSYWINYTIDKENIKEMKNSDLDLPQEDYDSVNWESFYKLRNLDFDLEKAIFSSVNWDIPIKQLNNELYPEEGNIDEKHLESFSKVILELYGDQEIEFYIHFLSTNEMDDSELYEGKISELISFLKKRKFRLSPSLIYSKEKSWVINTDYDLAFSTIGGRKELINRLIDKHPKEIYKVDY